MLRWWLSRCWLSRGVGLRDATDAALEFEEEEEEDDEVEEEEELEMFDETFDWFEHSSWRPRRLCEGSCAFAHGEQELHPSTLRAADCGRASAVDHG